MNVRWQCAVPVLVLLAALTSAAAAKPTARLVVATVNREPVSCAQLVTRLNGLPPPVRAAEAQKKLERLTLAAIVAQYGRRNGIAITGADVDRGMVELKAKYPPGDYATMLTDDRLTEADIRDSVRAKLTLAKGVDSGVPISLGAVQKYLDAHHATLDTPENVEARHILLSSQDTANTVEAKLQGLTGKALADAFAALAKQYSTDPSSAKNGGELGYFKRGVMVKPFEDAAFSQQVGVVGPVVESPFGFHVILVEDHKAAQVATMDNSSARIRDLLRDQRSEAAINTLFQKLRKSAKVKVFASTLKTCTAVAKTK